MSYAPPSIGAAGLTIPAFNDILNWLIGQFQQVYGAASYLGTDSADYQDIAVRSLQASDIGQSMQALYLSMNPQTATGTSLDRIGRLIGTPRKPASYSTALLTVTGTPGTVINSGVAKDVNGYLWSLPSPTTIGAGGSVMVIATCQTAGNITANPGDISSIQTPTAGWFGVTNSTAATPGGAVEADSAYRARLLLAQAKPSLTMLAGTAAAVAAVSGVTRSIVYENPYSYTASYGVCNTSGTTVTILTGYPLDSSDVGAVIYINGTGYNISAVSGSTVTISTSAGTQTGVLYYIGSSLSLGPKNSITAVVEGGTAADIAQAIYANKGIGCYTNGTTLVTVSDPLNPAITLPIQFDVLAYVPVYVSMSVHALAGFTTATQTAIATAIVNYLDSLGIGQSVVYSELYGAALEARPNPDTPLFSIRSVQSGSAAAQTTGNTTSGSPTVTVASATGITTGQTVAGTGIPAGTTVSGISGTTVTLSANATANGAAVALAFFTLGTSDINIAYNAAAQGAAADVLVTLV